MAPSTPKDVPQALLDALATGEQGIDTRKFAESLGVDHQQVVGALKSIQAIAEGAAILLKHPVRPPFTSCCSPLYLLVCDSRPVHSVCAYGGSGLCA